MTWKSDNITKDRALTAKDQREKTYEDVEHDADNINKIPGTALARVYWLVMFKIGSLNVYDSTRALVNELSHEYIRYWHMEDAKECDTLRKKIRLITNVYEKVYRAFRHIKEDRKVVFKPSKKAQDLEYEHTLSFGNSVTNEQD